MQEPDEGPDENAILCVECGSDNVEPKEKQYFLKPANQLVTEYHCNDCNIDFIPAFDTPQPLTEHRKNVERWSFKVDQTGWQERRRQEKNKKYFVRKYNEDSRG